MVERAQKGVDTLQFTFAETSLAAWSFLEPVVKGSEASVHTGALAAWNLEEGTSDVSQLMNVQGQGQG